MRSGHPSLLARVARLAPIALASAVCASACAQTQLAPSWPPLAKKWFDRASASYHEVDFDDAETSVENALRVEPNRPEIRLLAARIAIADLDYDRTIKALEGLDSADARGLRGRALWYSGQIDRAADELEALVADPEVRDGWAQEVARLARRGGSRKPFTMSGGMLASVAMPQVGANSFVVPLELDGEPVLGLVATGTPEVVIDSGGGRQPSWVSLRFGERIEVKDVPALTKDLTGISRQINAPIKVLLGVNLLRHVHPTIDFEGGQFIVRSADPPPPARATTVHLNYIRGGGMVLRTNLGSNERSAGSLLVDTAMPFPIALDERGWEKAGVALSSLQPVPSGGHLKHGVLPRVVLGAFDIPQVPAVYGAPLEEFEKGLDVNLDGLAGAGLIAAFRATLADGGRSLWLEDTTSPFDAPRAPDASPPGTPGDAPPISAPPTVPTPSATPPS
jgi:tetratricopeptide (TPR) repeat protein